MTFSLRQTIAGLGAVLTGTALLGLASMPAHSAEGEPIPVGVCQSTAQGPAKFAAALLNGARISIDAFNAKGGAGGRRIEIVPVDIGNNDPAQARLSFSKAIEINKIVALLCWGTNVMVQNAPVIDDAGVAAFTISQGMNVTKKSKLTQQLEALTTLQCRAAAKYTKANHPEVKRLAVLYVNYEYGIEVRDQCQIEFGKVGVEMVASEAHPNAPSDLRAQTTKLLESKPDAIYLAAIGGGTIPLGIRAGRELGYEGVYITSTSGDTPDVYNFKLAEKDFYFTSHAVPARAPQSVKDATDKFGGYVGAGFDYGWLVTRYAQQLVDAGKPVTGRDISALLRAESRVETPVNGYVFKQDGDTVRPLAIFGVSNGGRKLLQEYTVTDIEG